MAFACAQTQTKRTLYCLYFFPTSFLESFKETDQPAGRGPLEEMPGECKTAGLPGPLPGGRPGFLFFTSLPDCSSLRFLPGLTSWDCSCTYELLLPSQLCF